MGTFDQSKGYQQKGDGVFFDDGREIELLHYVYNQPDIESIRGSPERVLQLLDSYGREKKYLMNVGELKGKIVTDLIAEVKPQTMVELGGYVGYSTVLFASAVAKAGGKAYYSLERNPEFAAVISSLLDLAGLSHIAKVVVGPSDNSLRRLHKEGRLQGIDMMFLDHYKPAYKTDLQLAEELGLIHKGTVMAADNVIYPGNPPYLEYVRASCDQKRTWAEQGGKAGPDERFKDKTAKQYATRQGDETVEVRKGNPNIKYESRIIDSFEPTGEPDGIEVTKCVAIES